MCPDKRLIYMGNGTTAGLTSLLPVRLQAPEISLILMSMLSYKESLAFQRRLSAFSRYLTLSAFKIAVKPLPAPLVTTHFDFSHTVFNYGALRIAAFRANFYKFTSTFSFPILLPVLQLRRKWIARLHGPRWTSDSCRITSVTGTFTSFVSVKCRPLIPTPILTTYFDFSHRVSYYRKWIYRRQSAKIRALLSLMVQL